MKSSRTRAAAALLALCALAMTLGAALTALLVAAIAVTWVGLYATAGVGA